MNPTILIVDDDPFLRQQISDYFRVNGLTPVMASNGEQALLNLKQADPQLIVLDLGLPDVDGTTVARLIRSQSRIPIIMLTARSATADKLLGFEIGADDYLTKPFEPAELVARVKALIRRTGSENAPAAPATAMEVGNLNIDPSSRKVTIDGTVLSLTNREYDLLAYLMKHMGRALSREQIFEQVWGYDIEFSSNTLDVMVYRLRTKITSHGGPDAIQTLRGFGYMLGTQVA